MRTKLLVGLCAGLLALGLWSSPTVALAQDDPVVTDGGIVPKPNSGKAPEEAGDRGGALQLMLPALLVVAIGGGTWHLVRQARANQRSDH